MDCADLIKSCTDDCAAEFGFIFGFDVKGLVVVEEEEVELEEEDVVVAVATIGDDDERGGELSKGSCLGINVGLGNKISVEIGISDVLFVFVSIFLFLFFPSKKKIILKVIFEISNNY